MVITELLQCCPPLHTVRAMVPQQCRKSAPRVWNIFASDSNMLHSIHTHESIGSVVATVTLERIVLVSQLKGSGPIPQEPFQVSTAGKLTETLLIKLGVIDVLRCCTYYRLIFIRWPFSAFPSTLCSSWTTWHESTDKVEMTYLSTEWSANICRIIMCSPEKWCIFLQLIFHENLCDFILFTFACPWVGGIILLLPETRYCFLNECRYFWGCPLMQQIFFCTVIWLRRK